MDISFFAPGFGGALDLGAVLEVCVRLPATANKKAWGLRELVRIDLRWKLCDDNRPPACAVLGRFTITR